MIEATVFPGQYIVGQYEPCNHIYFILEGTASVEINIDGKDHELDVLK